MSGGSREDRDRQSALLDHADRLVPAPAAGSASMVVRTFVQTTYPTVAGSYYACNPVDVGGTEAEGQPGAFATTTGVCFVLNLGSVVIPASTSVIADGVSGRWVTRYDG